MVVVVVVVVVVLVVVVVVDPVNPAPSHYLDHQVGHMFKEMIDGIDGGQCVKHGQHCSTDTKQELC